MPSINNINITSTTTFNGKYAYFLGSTYGWVYWNSTSNRWDNKSALGSGVLYNYLLSTALQPITSPTAQWVNVIPGFEIFAVVEGNCAICYTITSTTVGLIFINDLETYLESPLTYTQPYYPFSENDPLLPSESTTMFLTSAEAIALDGSADWIITGPIICPSPSTTTSTSTTSTTTSTTSTSTTSTTSTSTTSSTTTTTLPCDCVEYYNNTGGTLNNISYTDCTSGNPVGPIAVTPGQSFCTSTTPIGSDAGFLSILSFNCCP